jgi:large subunit ribosomal protein L32
MAVPKKKTTPSRRGMRRSHDALKTLGNITFDKTTGEAKLAHHISMIDGYYKGKQVVKVKSKFTESAEDQSAAAE